MKLACLLTALVTTAASGQIYLSFHNGQTTVNAMNGRPDGTVVATGNETWNNISNNGGQGLSFSGVALLDAAGNTSGATVTGVGGLSNFNNSGWGSQTQDHVMMEGWYGFRATETLTIAGLPPGYAGSYSVIIYGDPGSSRTMNYTIGSETKTIVRSSGFDGTFAEGSQMVSFSGLTGNTFTISGNPGTGDSRSAINGIAIIPGDPTAPPGNLSTSVAPSFPTQVLTSNPNPGTNLGFSRVANGNTKGQSFSLPTDATVGGMVFEVASVATSGNFRLEIFRAIDDLPWLPTPVFRDAGSLPEGLAAGDLLQIDFANPVELSRGSYLVAISGLTADFNLRLSNDSLYLNGKGARNSTATNGWIRLTAAESDFVFAALGTAQDPLPSAPNNAPNLIFILTDDYGWTDVQAGSTGPNVLDGVNYGSTYYQTPNLERLASEGLSFTHCFAHPNCAPTRAAILSGQYAPRSGNGVYNVFSLNRGGNGTTYLGPSQNEDVPAAHTIVAEALQEGGYVTAHIGKYHVGGNEGGETTLPENNGYDFNFGGGRQGNPGNYHASGETFDGSIGEGLDFFAKDYDSNYVSSILEPITTGNTPATLLDNSANSQGSNKNVEDSLGDAAIAFMEEVRSGPLSDRPFYLQLHNYSVHTPVSNNQARADLLEKYQNLTSTDPRHSNAAYAALNENIDQTIGRILDYLEDPDGDGNPADSIAGNTLVIFTSDNGGHIGPTDNDPLRHRKGSFYNGGIRVPLIAWQPGTIPAGQQTDTLVHSVDFYPTLVEHAGLPMPAGLTFDGESFSGHLSNPQTPRERSPICYHFPGYMDTRTRPCSVIIKRVNGQDYKLIHTYDPTYTGNPTSSEDQAEGLDALTDPWELYRFNEDLGETNDLCDDTYSNQLLYQDIADELAQDLNTWLTQDTPGWQPALLTQRSNGEPIPFAPPSSPQLPLDPSKELLITAATYSAVDEAVTLTWNSELNFEYQIEGSSDLSDWTPLTSNIDAEGPTTSHTFSDDAANSAKRFYRVLLLP